MYDQPTDWMEDACFEFNPWEPGRLHRLSKPRKRESAIANEYGDTVSRDNITGRITAFRYCEQGTCYFFEYDKDGRISSINRSDGWVWRRVNSNAFNGWIVRNYFESWKVSDQDCGAVVIDEAGVRATGTKVDMMGLPERRN